MIFEDKKKILWDLPGGATLLPAFVGAVERMVAHNLKPYAMVTVSVDSLAAVPFALSFYDKRYMQMAKKASLSILPSHIWAKHGNPYTKKGGFSFWGFMRMITLRESFGIQNTRPILMKYVRRADFYEYKRGCKLGELPEIFIATWDKFKTGQQIFHRAADLSYEDYVETVEASAHIDTITNPVRLKGWGLQVDSGRLDQNAGHKFLNGKHLNNADTIKYRKGIDAVISVYPRKENKIRDGKSKSWFFENNESIKDTILESSEGDEAQMYKWCHRNGVDFKKIILDLPDTLTYETNENVLRKLYGLGLKQAEEQLLNGCILDF